MLPKKKATGPRLIQNLDDVNAVIGDLHALELDHAQREAKMEKELAAVRAKHQDALSRLERQREALEKQLEAAIRDNLQWLGGRSSVKVLNGVVGLRKKPPSIHLPKDAVERLKQLGTEKALDAIRTTEGPNKNKLKEWSLDELARIGGKVVTEVGFFVKNGNLRP